MPNNNKNSTKQQEREIQQYLEQEIERYKSLCKQWIPAPPQCEILINNNLLKMDDMSFSGNIMIIRRMGDQDILLAERQYHFPPQPLAQKKFDPVTQYNIEYSDDLFRLLSETTKLKTATDVIKCNEDIDKCIQEKISYYNRIQKIKLQGSSAVQDLKIKKESLKTGDANTQGTGTLEENQPYILFWQEEQLSKKYIVDPRNFFEKLLNVNRKKIFEIQLTDSSVPIFINMARAQHEIEAIKQKEEKSSSVIYRIYKKCGEIYRKLFETPFPAEPTIDNVLKFFIEKNDHTAVKFLAEKAISEDKRQFTKAFQAAQKLLNAPTRENFEHVMLEIGETAIEHDPPSPRVSAAGPALKPDNKNESGVNKVSEISLYERIAQIILSEKNKGKLQGNQNHIVRARMFFARFIHGCQGVAGNDARLFLEKVKKEILQDVKNGSFQQADKKNSDGGNLIPPLTLNQDSPTLNQDSPTLNQDSPTLNQDSLTLNQDSLTLNQEKLQYLKEKIETTLNDVVNSYSFSRKFQSLSQLNEKLQEFFGSNDNAMSSNNADAEAEACVKEIIEMLKSWVLDQSGRVGNDNIQLIQRFINQNCRSTPIEFFFVQGQGTDIIASNDSAANIAKNLCRIGIFASGSNRLVKPSDTSSSNNTPTKARSG